MIAYGADYVTRDGRLVIDEPEISERSSRRIDSYTAIYRKGCTPPDSVLGRYRQQRGIPCADRRDDAEPLAFDPERAEERAARRLLREHGDDRMAARSFGGPFPIIGAVHPPWSSRTAATSPRPRSSSASWSARAGSRTISTSRASACCRRCRSCSMRRSGSTRATRTAWRAAMQVLTQRTTRLAEGQPRSGGLVNQAERTDLAEGRASRRDRRHQPRAGGRRGDRADQGDFERVAGGCRG